MDLKEALEVISQAGVNVQQQGEGFQLQLSLGQNDQLERLLQAALNISESAGNPEAHLAWHALYEAAQQLGPVAAIRIGQLMLRAMEEQQSNSGIWIHKGLPYFLIWGTCARQGWEWQMRRFALLTLIEDALRDFDGGVFKHENSGAYRLATMSFGTSADDMNILGLTIRELADSYPESEYSAELIFPDLLSKCEVARGIMRTTEAKTHFEPVTNARIALTALLKNKSQREYKAGESLERLIEVLFFTIPGANVSRDVQGLFQVDVYADVSANVAFAIQVGPRLIAECKDYAKPASIDVAAKLLATCHTADCKLGIIFAKDGITGEAGVKHATRVALQSYLQFGIAILVFDEHDLEQCIAVGGIASMISTKLMRARLGVF